MAKSKVTKEVVKAPELHTKASKGICRWAEEHNRGTNSSKVELHYSVGDNDIFIEFIANTSKPIKANKKDLEQAIDEIKKHLTF